MARCPKCGAECLTTVETAASLGVSTSRVRKILAKPWRLDAGKIGQPWVVSASEVKRFSPQPTGVHLPKQPNNGDINLVVCSGCGEQFYSVRQSAGFLRVSPSKVYQILQRPHLLDAFKLGKRWVIPKSALEVYRVGQQLLEVLADDNGHGDELPPLLQLAAAIADGLPPEGEDLRADTIKRIVVEVVHRYRPAICFCSAYPFPHRPGGGRCKEDPFAAPVGQRPD
jgi:hypothetical protein